MNTSFVLSCVGPHQQFEIPLAQRENRRRKRLVVEQLLRLVGQKPPLEIASRLERKRVAHLAGPFGFIFAIFT